MFPAIMACMACFAAMPLRADEVGAAAAGAAPGAPAPVRVQLHLAQGDVVLALDADHAPATVANFLKYIDAHLYDGATFYRAVKLDDEATFGMVQGGLHGQRKKLFKPVAHEAPAQTGLHHFDGAVSMARNAPGTATSEFFIVIGDLISLDGMGDDPGYAVFGKVESGLEAIRALLTLPRSADAGDGSMQGEILATPVKVLSVQRLPAAATGTPAAPGSPVPPVP